MQHSSFVFVIALLQQVLVFAQPSGSFFGKTIDSNTLKPIEYVVVTVKNTSLMQLTDVHGDFRFNSLAKGEYWISFSYDGYKEALFLVKIPSEDSAIDLGTIFLEEDIVTYNEDYVITLSDSDFRDEENGTDSSPSILNSTKDVFQQSAAFSWSQARFSIRGIDSQYSNVMINGIEMNKPSDGRALWSNWGGLNDVLKNQETTLGTSTSDYAFGDILGTSSISTRASSYIPGTRISFSSSNSSFNWRAIATHSSSMSAKGWAYTISAAKRYAGEGYFDGTSYDANSFFISVEKKLNEEHSLNFTAFYTPSSRAKNSPITNEVFYLTSGKYNSYWGYQVNEKRNARVKIVEEPVFMLNHYFTINENSRLDTGLMFQTGTISNTNLDYQNANSPDPVYYRKLPSYYTSLYTPDNGEFEGEPNPDFENAEKSKTAFLAMPQIDWEAIYKTNQKPVLDSNGTVSGYEPNTSKIVLYGDETADSRIIAKSILNTRVTDNLIFNSGASFSASKSNNYQKLIDLLGGNSFKDIDAFYTGDKSQSDLNNPNRFVIVGDKYGYNYDIFAGELNFFTQFLFSYSKIDFYLAQEFTKTTYERNGMYRNGIYPDLSFGKKEVNFENLGFKGGLTYKISGKQFISLNALYKGNAPTVRNTFSNVRLNNLVSKDLENEKISSLDINYNYRISKLNARITGFYNTIRNATRVSFFYAEGIFETSSGLNTDAFLSQTLTNLDKRNIGLELSLNYQLHSNLRTYFAASIGEYTYSGNPSVTIANDASASASENPAPVYDFGVSKLKNYKQAGSPQQAYSLGLEYRNPKYWWVGTNINYISNNYIDVSPIKRTDKFFINPTTGKPFPEADEERAKELLKQEKLPPVILLNLVGGKSWRVKGKYIGLFFSINNLLSSLYKTGGYEQARKSNYRDLNHDVSSGTPSFGNKYYYGYETTYFANINLSM